MSSEDEAVSNLLRPKEEPKSLIAKLAESRKAKKSIFSYGPIALSAASPVKTSVLKQPPVTSAGTSDLLGSILASQEQLSSFGREPREPARPRPRQSSRVLGAILASQATLNLLDGEIQLAKEGRRQPARTCSVRQGDTGGQGSSSNQQSSSNSSTVSANPASQSNGTSTGPSFSVPDGSSGCGGSGDDPDRNGKKKLVPDDKKEDADEEDVDLYSDIESVEEEDTDALEALPDAPLESEVI